MPYITTKPSTSTYKPREHIYGMVCSPEALVSSLFDVDTIPDNYCV